MATLENKNLYWAVRNSQGKLIYKSKNEAKAKAIYNRVQSQENWNQERRERVGYLRWY